jgi:hypothetical protein
MATPTVRRSSGGGGGARQQERDLNRGRGWSDRREAADHVARSGWGRVRPSCNRANDPFSS